MTSIICLFELVHLNDLLFDEWVDHVVKEALKSSIFVAQKAAAPKSGLEFRQGANGTIRSSLATSYDVARRRATLHMCVETFLKFVSRPTDRPSIHPSIQHTYP